MFQPMNFEPSYDNFPRGLFPNKNKPMARDMVYFLQDGLSIQCLTF
jgi:hypothetical protein